jgi:hypothetical protein
MLSEIGSWRRRENSGGFTASRLPEEREADFPEAHYREADLDALPLQVVEPRNSAKRSGLAASIIESKFNQK